MPKSAGCQSPSQILVLEHNDGDVPKNNQRARVAVGVTVGKSVAGGRGVCRVSEDRGITVGGAEVAQAARKTNKNMPKPERVIYYPFIQAAYGRLRLWARRQQLEQRFFFGVL
jgi:hypothetical protein